jgi:HEAT repeat protein
LIGAAGVWMLAGAWSGLALALMLGLIAYRAVADRVDSVRGRERLRYIELLKARAEPASEAAAGDILTDLSVQILEFVRGDEKAEFAERVARAGAAARLHRRLRRGDARMRVLTAAALANFRDEASRAALTAALDDRNAEVRLTAALSLASNGQAPPPAELIGRLGIGERETSLRTVMLLAQLADSDPGGVRALLADPEAAPSVRAAAARALALNDDFASVSVIVDQALAADPRSDDLPRLLNALALFAHPAGSAAVLRALDSPSPKVRAAAARAAGRIGIGCALPRLEARLGDPDWWVRLRAAHALMRLGETGQAALRRVADAGDEPARETAALTLAELARPA